MDVSLVEWSGPWLSVRLNLPSYLDFPGSEGSSVKLELVCGNALASMILMVKSTILLLRD